jgi:hypothetical protein
MANMRVWTLLYALAFIPLVIGCLLSSKGHARRDQFAAALTAPDG